MNITLTGAKGFVGSNLVKKLSKDHNVISFNGDIRTESIYDGSFIKANLVIHLAGKNKISDEGIIDHNLNGSLNIIKYCLNHNKPIILAGSNYREEGAYKTSKETIKMLCKSYSYVGLNSLILNLPKVIGPGCKPFYNSFVSTLIYAKATNQLKIYEKQIKDMDEEIELIHIDRVCEAVCESISSLPLGCEEYQFNEYDGVFKLTFREIIEILNGYEGHWISPIFFNLIKWYKENPNV